MKIVAFAASNSSQSINRALASYAAHLVPEAEVDLLDLNDFEMPIFSEDRERESGQPPAAGAFLARIAAADALVISYAEHNGSFSVAYKNVVDWASRISRKVFQQKPTLMLAASPGAGGAASVLALAERSAPSMGAEVTGTVSVPRFHDHFDLASGQAVDGEPVRRVKAAVEVLSATVAGAGQRRAGRGSHG
ncbi:NADPH-dependent oxidoreductase [Seongchinamella unica]|uniref:NADPH-dependent oxidoreductase n=1 Tax=Seongchinamella unica TaxID=2547392 RepID=A0A4R5LQJ9_9GAMM|nr:NAD(P)H-dependent oxidoreductase [Seongchinamella unica]TDG12686.1 NADPH-dependent oxidoreductase [Seongchinamella unica]